MSYSNVATLSRGDLAQLDGRLSALPDGWTTVRDLRFGAAERAAFAVVHRKFGVALVDLAPADPSSAAEALRAFLRRERFAEFFPGELPIVAVSIAPEAIADTGEAMAQAFEAVDALTIADADWAESLVELLLPPVHAAAEWNEAPPPPAAPRGRQAPAPARPELVTIPTRPVWHGFDLSDTVVARAPPRRRRRSALKGLALLFLAGAIVVGAASFLNDADLEKVLPIAPSSLFAPSPPPSPTTRPADGARVGAAAIRPGRPASPPPAAATPAYRHSRQD